MARVFDVLQLVLIIFLIVFGIFIIYQIILKILGGSWETEAIIISLLALLIGLCFTIALNQIKYNTDYNYFKKDMYNFIKEFKKVKEEIVDSKV